MPLRAIPFVLALSLVTALPAAAQRAPGGPEAFGAALRAQAERLGVRDAVVVVRRGGREVHRTVMGRADPARPEPVASISKAITAACIATILQERGRGLDTRLGDVAPRLLSASGRTGDPRIAAITIAQLITHTAGLAGNMGDGEISTGAGMMQGIAANGPGADTIAINARRALALGQKRAAGGFRYSNDGYTILGAVIEEMTGEPYERACGSRVLARAGISARLDRGWAFMGPYGGWAISGLDVLTLFDALTADARIAGRAAFDWHRTAAVPELGARRYGLGIRLQPGTGGTDQWHTGSWNGSYVPRGGGPRVSTNFWNIVVRTADGTSWYVRIDRTIRGIDVNRTIDAFFAAYRSVTRW